MQREPATIDRCSVENATWRAFSMGEESVKNALSFLADPERKQRLEVPECKCCFYLYRSRIGGAACTSRPCAFCETVIHSGSTNIAQLCPDCAKKYELCSHCGGDLEMRRKRRKHNYPRRQEEKKEPVQAGVFLLPLKELPK